MNVLIYIILDKLFNNGNLSYKNYVVLQDAYGSVRGYFKNEKRMMWHIKAKNISDYTVGYGGEQ